MSGRLQGEPVLGSGLAPSGILASAASALPSPAHSAVTIFSRHDADSLVIPLSAQTLDGFREWALSESFPEVGRITFVDGEIIVDMSPESIEEHSAVKTEVCRVLANLVRSERLGQLHIDGVLISNKNARVSNEPDALFISRSMLQSGRLTFTAEKGRPESSKEIVGAVDWVLEIISPSSRRKDEQLLRTAYFEAGIAEYWLVDALVGADDDVKFQILVPSSGGYIPVEPHDGWLWSVTFGCAFRLSRLRDEDGYWLYTLDMQKTS